MSSNNNPAPGPYEGVTSDGQVPFVGKPGDTRNNVTEDNTDSVINEQGVANATAIYAAEDAAALQAAPKPQEHEDGGATLQQASFSEPHTLLVTVEVYKTDDGKFILNKTTPEGVTTQASVEDKALALTDIGTTIDDLAA